MHTRLTRHSNIRRFIETFDDTVLETCRATCKSLKTPTKKLRGKTVPWWSYALALTTMRKRTNALRRLYQRTKNNNGLRESRSVQYATAKTAYQAATRKEKTLSCKKHCTAASPTNPWNGTYKIASGKTRQRATRQHCKNRTEQ